ncbi:DUF2461 family protein, partial [uncultured Planktosalinus sp.]|uniref:DUF2461 family protein n=1 Tax=uncultured Planktosalinus sp. TaxID=1810935 RepID=UPI0030DA7FAB
FKPEAPDLFRIRKEFELDDSEIRQLLNEPEFKSAFGGFDTSDQVKTAPKGFDKTHKAIDLIKNKNYFVTKKFTDKEVLASDFSENILKHFRLVQPFFSYMSEILTTDLNGETVI